MAPESVSISSQILPIVHGRRLWRASPDAWGKLPITGRKCPVLSFEVMLKTSESHPLRIDSVTVPRHGGRIGMTLCPGKIQRGALTGDWRRDLGTDLAVIEGW